MLRILKRVLLVLVIVVVVVVALAATWAWWSYPKRSVDSVLVGPPQGSLTFADIPLEPPLSADEIDDYARRLLDSMTLEQKVLQMSGDTWVWDFIGERMVGRSWEAGVDDRLGLRPLVYADGPRGLGVGYSTCFPVAMARAASWDRDLERRVGEVIGKEARGHGVDVWLGPTLNLLRHPLWGRAQETYGEDPYLLGEMAAAVTLGVQSHNVMACAKHYALNSIEMTRMKVDVQVDERTLREVYLPHFRRVVEADVATVMTAYNKVNGHYASENPHLVREILKGDWGFEGYVVSDWFTGVHDGVKAAKAGLDLEMPMVQVYGSRLVEAVKKGEVDPKIVDEAVLRMLRRRLEYASRPDPTSYDASLVRATEHVAFTREVAEKSVVLLHNEGVLPLERGEIGTLAVLGPLADTENIGDHGSSRVRPTEVVTVLEGLRADLGTSVRLLHEPGTDLEKAREAAREADVAVVVVGFTYEDEGEYIPIPYTDPTEWGGDREDLALEAAERALIEAVAAESAPTVVILMGGAAITVEGWSDQVEAILMAFYPGEQGGAALARILFGDVNPSARLPFTVPEDASQLPPFDNESLEVEYGYYHGYTLADEEGWDPAFPFGHGLSYTTWAYANLAVEESEVGPDGTIVASVDLTNTGDRVGQEVVQLYVAFPESAVKRPKKLLRGFEKVSLGPGETKRVRLSVKARDLAYYDADAGEWVVERDTYRALVGPSSRDFDLLSAPFTVVD